MLLDYRKYIVNEVRDDEIQKNFKRVWLTNRPLLDKIEIFWIVCTSLVPIYLFITDKPFWSYFVVFILLDLLGVFFNYVCFKWIPSLINNSESLERQQNYCNQLLKNLKHSTHILERNIKFKQCQKCRYLYSNGTDENGLNRYQYNSNCNDTLKRWVSYINDVRRAFEVESVKLEEMLSKIQKEEKKNKKQESKEKFGTDVKEEQLQNYIKILTGLDDLNIKRVKTLTEEISSLINVLNKRPEVTKYVPETIYIYLNELSNLLGKYSNLKEDIQKGYKLKIQAIVDELIRIISELSKKLSDMDLEDFDVSLDVLYRDLFPMSRE